MQASISYHAVVDNSSDVMTSARKIAGQQSASGGMFAMTMWGFAAGMLFSGVGLIYIRYGKATGNNTMMVCGFALLGYSYFMSDTTYIMLAGAALCVLPHIADKLI